ncbi:hypothetical protein [Brevifollis gellanilyticus]|uniref:TRASH domain-containing protein n=1 Tax=Brevifollis gellanilyticus TaxID=748831 RepID=A0A512MEU4_9BACT|nr:hypothetical protein [Brevifollis gellanilyticus]GEP45226.1 hypothetical protein BGE01nite_45170 [Brevifollis gellanilyticus]
MKALIPSLLLALVSITAVFAKGGPPINEACPVDGKKGRLIYRTFGDEGTIIFCSVECMEAYKKNPSAYKVVAK